MRRYGSGNGGFREAMAPGETGYSGSWKGVSMWTTVLSYLILFMVFVNFPRELSAKDQRRQIDGRMAEDWRGDFSPLADRVTDLFITN
jgi:hypothetical protein